MASKRSPQDIQDEILVEPEGFVFNPACGVYDPETKTVAVSGYKFTPREIERDGQSYRTLSDIFQKIQKRDMRSGMADHSGD